MSFFPEHERLRLQKLNLEDELLSLHEREKALREIVSELEELESIRKEEQASKIINSILEEIRQSASPTLPKRSFEWSASPKKVRELYATQTKALWR